MRNATLGLCLVLIAVVVAPPILELAVAESGAGDAPSLEEQTEQAKAVVLGNKLVQDFIGDQAYAWGDFEKWTTAEDDPIGYEVILKLAAPRSIEGQAWPVMSMDLSKAHNTTCVVATCLFTAKSIDTIRVRVDLLTGTVVQITPGLETDFTAEFIPRADGVWYETGD